MMHAALSAMAAIAIASFFALTAGDGSSPAAGDRDRSTIYQFKVQDIDGEEVSLAKYRGQVCLIVNTASR